MSRVRHSGKWWFNLIGEAIHEWYPMQAISIVVLVVVAMIAFAGWGLLHVAIKYQGPYLPWSQHYKPRVNNQTIIEWSAELNDQQDMLQMFARRYKATSDKVHKETLAALMLRNCKRIPYDSDVPQEVLEILQKDFGLTCESKL